MESVVLFLATSSKDSSGPWPAILVIGALFVVVAYFDRKSKPEGIESKASVSGPPSSTSSPFYDAELAREFKFFLQNPTHITPIVREFARTMEENAGSMTTLSTVLLPKPKMRIMAALAAGVIFGDVSNANLCEAGMLTLVDYQNASPFRVPTDPERSVREHGNDPTVTQQTIQAALDDPAKPASNAEMGKVMLLINWLREMRAQNAKAK